MASIEYVQVLFVLICIFTLSFPLGKFIARLFQNRFQKIEKIHSTLFSSFDIKNEMDAGTYLKNILFFNLLGFVAVFLILIFQKYLPLNPQNFPNVEWMQAFNIAISFVTNTNWQSYSGEATLSYFSQMSALGVQNFLSASTGICVLFVLIRAFKNSENQNVGNFFDDLLKVTFYVLLPLSIIFSIGLISQGVIQNFSSYWEITTLEGMKQVIPMGPVASQEAIKILGTNGGGFFNANSAHPFENPTAISNLMQLVGLLILPASLIVTFGELLKKQKEALIIYFVMGFILLLGVGISLWSETLPHVALDSLVNFEGREFRFHNSMAALWSVFTTAASNGSVNAMMSSLNPITTAVALFNMMLGEIVFGGVGSGLYGFILFVLLAVFVAGLMVGRTPEYLGKKIEAFEIKMVVLGLLIPNLCILIGVMISLVSASAQESLSHHGVHGLSEIVYAITSASANNGSAFAGLNANTFYFNFLLGIFMLISRFGVIWIVFQIARSLAKKKIIPISQGTLKTDNFTFGLFTTFIIVTVGGLTFFPLLVLGPILEHMLMTLKILV